MRTHTAPHLGFLVTPPSLPHCLAIVQFTGEDMPSQAIEPAVEMMAHIDHRQISHFTDLLKRVPFKKMQAERLPLILAQRFNQFSPAGSAEQPLPDRSYPAIGGAAISPAPTSSNSADP